MSEWSVSLCAAILLLAGVIELVSVANKRLFYPKVMALGLFMLSSRLWYLIWLGELGRLNIWGMGPIMLMATSRLLYCVSVMKQRIWQ